MRTTINTIYIIFAFAVTILYPLILIMGTRYADNAIPGLIAALLSFILIGSYVVNSMILQMRN